MKQRIINILSAILQAIDTLLCKMGIKKPTVVIALDGGICSQMFNYIKGARFAETGCKVLYDTRWFLSKGTDLTGLFARDYELPEMFPSLHIQYVSARKAKGWYSRFFKHSQSGGLVNVKDVKRTTYFGSQYAQDKDAYARLFPIYFNETTIRQIDVPWSREEGVIHCGVHVRRGDLSIPRPEYGMVTKDYFPNAIEYVKDHYPHVRFHFFSDEMDWVEQNILPRVDIRYDLIKGNKAWQDLALLSKCDIIIASQGSFGRMAAQLRAHAEIILCKSDLMTDYLGRDTHVTLID